MTDLENREAFEMWISTKGWIYVGMGNRKVNEILIFDNDYQAYHFRSIQECWESWNASTQRQGFKLAPLEPSEEMYSDLSRHLCRYMQMKDRYCPKTLGDYIERYIGFKNIPQWLHDEVRDWESTHAFATADLGVFIYKAMINAV